MSTPMISVRGLTKRYGSTTAVDDLSFTVREGAVTAFLGPNGAGKTTTIRMLLGLAPPDAGEALVLGKPYQGLQRPVSVVGTLIDGAGFHPGRTARNHLRVLASMTGISERRVDEVIRAVDLAGAADRKVGGFSLGMRRRLGLACALLGDPRILILDEPANGLDPAGIRWLRESLKSFAADGGTVLVSSHVLAEVAHTADDVVVINKGALVTQTTVEDLTAGQAVTVKVSDRDRLRRALAPTGAAIRVDGRDGLSLTGITARAVGEAAAREGLVVYELTSRGQSLEDVFMQLTTEGAEHAAS
ncbi:MAG TPA: ABC transporter ATP-binding protein [Acidimicrobiales bacterium]|jgi:ABC-2 type transport system ATP-binding protein|nr:ABC transporter ATP-binding protein [Acidimicrobiales bacterium]